MGGCAPEIIQYDRVIHCSGVHDKVQVVNADKDFVYVKDEAKQLTRMRLSSVLAMYVANDTKRQGLEERSPGIVKKITGKPNDYGATSFTAIPDASYFGIDEFAYATTSRSKGFAGGAYRYAHVRIYPSETNYPFVTVHADTGRYTTSCVDFAINVIADNKGSIFFNSVADGLNYMGTLGYDIVTAYPVERAGTYTLYSYLMRKSNK